MLGQARGWCQALGSLGTCQRSLQRKGPLPNPRPLFLLLLFTVVSAYLPAQLQPVLVQMEPKGREGTQSGNNSRSKEAVEPVSGGNAGKAFGPSIPSKSEIWTTRGPILEAEDQKRGRHKPQGHFCKTQSSLPQPLH